MFALLLALALAPAPCTAMIGIQADGTLFMQRDAGWRQSSPRQITDTIRAGCAGEPRQHTMGVTVAISPSASARSVQEMMDTLRTIGWKENLVQTIDWPHDQIPPR